MKVLVTGVGGQLGHDVMNELEKRNHEGIGSDLAEAYSGIADGSPVTGMPSVQLDITNREEVLSKIGEIRPDAIIHCAAWTAVDLADEDENGPKVRAVNVPGTRNIADAAGNVYGQSKLDGELAICSTLDKYFIVRTAWVFGLNGQNFIKTMINVGKKYDQVRVVNDQIGTPTYTMDLARLLVDMIETDKYGYYHATNSESEPGGYISWYDFCCEFYKQYGLTTKVIPVTTEEYGLSKAARPRNSRLDKSKLTEAGFRPLPTWQDAVCRYLKEADL